MDITPAIQEFIAMRAEVNANLNYENPTEADFQFEEATLINEFMDAETVCHACMGTDDNHYLSCSVWGFTKP